MSLIKSALASTFLAIVFSSALAKDHLVKSPGNHNDIQPAIQAAVDEAVNGDLIILPEGEFQFNKSVVITRFISIKGQGLKKTTLYRSEKLPDSLLNGRQWQAIFIYDNE